MSSAAMTVALRPYRALMRDYLVLSKARIVLMVLITAAAGYFFAADGADAFRLLNLLIGTALLAGGTNALNQYVEREQDGKMERTRLRPLPAGRMTPRAALIFSVMISIAGTAYLAATVNLLTAALGALTLATYILIYTPMKRVSSWCTLIGAIPGAIPPLMGWTAAENALGVGGWIAFAILFLWQMPHFMAISWMYRQDYGRAGFSMLSVTDAEGIATARQAVLYTVALFAATLVPVVLGMAGVVYAAGVTVAGLALFAAAVRFYADRSSRRAARLFIASNLYLVVVMLLLVTAAVPHAPTA
ncbi:MAG TPA: heme o synthase [Thermoanaerobaculia bacterium]|nr:heme o synthase [Thermoanaerobaculia bacterium]